ncbi:MAG: ParB N-terminal domain-containing protein, partial [Rhizonema sp. NSF051]|nr:ParB N-terminal domain-containing protein [Rhizonema sp. NSF051]
MTYQIEGKFYQLTPNVASLVSEKRHGYFTRNVEYHDLDDIRRDGGTQPRSAINLQHVKLLQEQMEDGQQLEPITVFYDGTQYWLADGFHRWHAHRNREEEAIACVIHPGSQREAVLYSVGANADHKPALPRSREDKRRAVLTLLSDPEWSTWSDRSIARRCKVSDKTVAHLRNSADTKLNIGEKSHLRN